MHKEPPMCTELMPYTTSKLYRAVILLPYMSMGHYWTSVCLSLHTDAYKGFFPDEFYTNPTQKILAYSIRCHRYGGTPLEALILG